MTKLLIPLAALVVAAGCQKPAEAPTAQEPPKEPEVKLGVPASELVAFEPGAQWVYDLEATRTTDAGDEKGSGEFTMKVEKVDRATSGLMVNLKAVDPGKSSSLLWRIGDDGLVQIQGTDGKNKPVVFDPPMPLIPPTVELDGMLGWKGTGARLNGTTGAIDVAITVIGEDEVDTASGRMKAWSIQSVAVWMEGKQQFRARTTSWWSPKVGLVRMIRELDAPEYGLKTVLRLKSHTVKQ